MPDFDFDAFNHDTPYEGEDGQAPAYVAESLQDELPAAPQHITPPTASVPEPVTEALPPLDNGSTEEVDKW